MANFSFDIVSEVDLQEVDNAVNQATKELLQRYDFKNSKSSIKYDREEKKITLIADDDFKLSALKDILATRLAKRGVSLKSLKFNEPEKAFEGYLRQVAEISMGISKEKAKELVDIIKGLKLKTQTQKSVWGAAFKATVTAVVLLLAFIYIPHYNSGIFRTRK